MPDVTIERKRTSADHMTILNTNWGHTATHYTAEFRMFTPGRRNLERALENIGITPNYEPEEKMLFVHKEDVPPHLTALFEEKKDKEIQR